MKASTLFHKGTISFQQAPITIQDSFHPEINQASIFKIIIQDDPILKNGRLSSTALITHYHSNEGFKTCNFQVKIYLKTERILFKFAHEYLIAGRLLNIQSPRNPGEFDFKKFLNRKNI